MNHPSKHLDPWLIVPIVSLSLLGLVMVTSSSMATAEHLFGQPLYFFYRQCIYLMSATVIASVLYFIPTAWWKDMRFVLLGSCFIMLIMLMIPGLTIAMNGSSRWLKIGPLHFQVSEWAKLVIIIYLAGYFDRHQHQTTQIDVFIKPLVVVAAVVILLLFEPDFGSSLVICLVAMGLLFLANMPLQVFLTLTVISAVTLAGIAVAQPYRMARLVSFLNPWSDPFTSGYQLTQALMAFGRGGIWGSGLGNSIQKLLYLPEAHTDFIFAVTIEELGAVTGIIMMILYAIVIVKSMRIGFRHHHHQRLFQALLSYGLGIWLALQLMISLGVNTGLLPTKGLTLPFFSYGGSSMLTNAFAFGLLLRLDLERQNDV